MDGESGGIITVGDDSPRTNRARAWLDARGSPGSKSFQVWEDRWWRSLMEALGKGESGLEAELSAFKEADSTVSIDVEETSPTVDVQEDLSGDTPPQSGLGEDARAEAPVADSLVPLARRGRDGGTGSGARGALRGTSKAGARKAVARRGSGPRG